MELWGEERLMNMFRGLIFNSNEKMSRINLWVVFFFPMRSHTLVFFHQHHKTSLRSTAIPDNLLGFRNHSEWVCVAPGPTPLPEGDKADTSQSPERHSQTHCARGMCVSLIMTLFQRRSCLSCHSHAGLLISCPPYSLLCFSEILIKRKDRDDECEIAPHPVT